MTCEEAVRTIPTGRYRHFKGKDYEVIAIARHSGTEEPMHRQTLSVCQREPLNIRGLRGQDNAQTNYI